MEEEGEEEKKRWRGGRKEERGWSKEGKRSHCIEKRSTANITGRTHHRPRR